MSDMRLATKVFFIFLLATPVFGCRKSVNKTSVVFDDPASAWVEMASSTKTIAFEIGKADGRLNSVADYVKQVMSAKEGTSHTLMNKLPQGFIYFTFNHHAQSRPEGYELYQFIQYGNKITLNTREYARRLNKQVSFYVDEAVLGQLWDQLYTDTKPMGTGLKTDADGDK
jgi:hypothetical protein